METNPNNHEKSLDNLIDMLGLREMLNADPSLNESGSNALILPGKKRKRIKNKNKASTRNIHVEDHVISKKMKKKLQKLQEEKEKKMKIAKSMEIIEKHKISEDAYSLLLSSATLGKVESRREKDRRAHLFLKAGLKLPDGISLFKRDKKLSENDAIRFLNDGQAAYITDSMRQVEKEDSAGSNLMKSAEKGVCEVVSQEISLQNDINEISPSASLVADVSQRHSEHIYAEGSMRQVEKEDSAGSNLMKSAEKGDCEIVSQEISLQNDINEISPAASFMADVSQRHSEHIYTEGSMCVSNKPGRIYTAKSILQTQFTGNQSYASLQGEDRANIFTVKLKPHQNQADNDNINPAIVVTVSRPPEVEEKRKELPIIMMEQEIMEAINENSAIIICGETGCGKTTQVPQFLYEAGYGSGLHTDRKGVIGITQPRRIAVLSTAKRVSYELGLKLGKEVGFQVRHDKMMGSDCSIKFMTDGILLREMQSDFQLKRYSVIILDEAHERNLNTDILIGMLSGIVRLRQELYEEQQKKISSGSEINPENLITRLKLVLMSATLRVNDFVSNKRLFRMPPPVLEVSVRQFPVTIHFSRKTSEDYLGQAYKKVMAINKKLPPGGILVFVTGQREVQYLCKKLQNSSQNLTKNIVNANIDWEPNDADDAFWMEGDFQKRKKFGFFYDERDDYEECSVEDESEDDSSIESDENGAALDLPSLKAAFKSIAGNVSNPCREEKHEIRSVLPLHVLPLYAMLPASDHFRVFEGVSDGVRLVVVATNVAETSLTIPGIKYVVDTGKEKVKNYNFGNGMASFDVQWISKASASQRTGRAGRTAPGHCYRLYSAAAFGKDDIFPEFSSPEITKIPVDSVVLLLKSMRIHNISAFPFPTPPKASAVAEAAICLKSIEALDADGKITSVGRSMAKYPIGPRHSRMILTVIEILRTRPDIIRANLVLGYAAAAAAALSFQNPFIARNHDLGDKLKPKKAMAFHQRFHNPTSDPLTIAFALQLFDLAKDSFNFCRDNSLHLKTMEDISKLRKQILRIILRDQHESQTENLWNHGGFRDVEAAWLVLSDNQPLRINEEEVLAQSICAGWADRIAKKISHISGMADRTVRKTSAISRSFTKYHVCAADEIVFINRMSSVYKAAPEYVIYNEIICVNERPYMHGITAVKPEWLSKYSKFLCSFSAPLPDPRPYYEPLSDNIYCWVNASFGRHNWPLPLICLPLGDETLRMLVFACALLEGKVLPCMRAAKDHLAANPSSMLRREGLGQTLVAELLYRLKSGSRKVDSRAKLRDALNEEDMFLASEILSWVQKSFHDQFEQLWMQVLCESQLQGFELFPNMPKKVRLNSCR